MLAVMIGLVTFCLLAAPDTYLRLLAPEAQKIAYTFIFLTILDDVLLNT